MELEDVKKHSDIDVQTKQDMFLKICALNYPNALVKQPEYKRRWGMV